MWVIRRLQCDAASILIIQCTILYAWTTHTNDSQNISLQQQKTVLIDRYRVSPWNHFNLVYADISWVYLHPRYHACRHCCRIYRIDFTLYYHDDSKIALHYITYTITYYKWWDSATTLTYSRRRERVRYSVCEYWIASVMRSLMMNIIAAFHL